MAKHWSAEMYVLCWSDSKSGGRYRMSWSRTREALERKAHEMDGEADPVLYEALNKRLTIRPPALPAPKEPKKRKRTRAKKSDALPVAA